MRDITIMDIANGYVHSVIPAPEHEIPGRYKNKDVFKITDVPSSIPLCKVIELYRLTTFGGVRRVIPYSEFKHTRVITR